MLNQTQATFAISLDDDAHFLSDNPLEAIETHFQSNPQCGLAAFRIFWNKSVPENTQTNQKPQRVKGFVGCGHAWRMSAWRDIPAYPEWFGFYGEEDFAAVQLFKKYWEVHYLPQVLVQHRIDPKARRNAKEFRFRYRHSIRAGWHLYFLFYPLAKIPGKFGYSFWMQLRKVFAGDFKVVVPLFMAVADVIAAIPNYIRNRNGLSAKEHAAFSRLPDTKIYWQPQNEKV
jgi:GT2 family glycosyltransferase